MKPKYNTDAEQINWNGVEEEDYLGESERVL